MKRYINRWLAGLTLILMAGTTFVGCGLLDVENPNSLVEDDLSNPAAASAMANGLEASTTRALGQIHKVYSTASDELKWTGSRDGFQQLDFGILSDPFNEFTDAAFPFVAEARWVSDNYIDRLEAFRAEGALSDRTPLIRTYLYKAIIYTTIADMFDNFAFSNRTEPGPPVGAANMASLYDSALEALSAAQALEPTGELATQVLAVQARIKFSKAVWAKVNPIDAANPLVSVPDAATDAQAALDMMGSPDWVYELVTDGGIGFVNDMGDWVNDRLEMVIGPTYVQANEAGNQVESVTFPDLIDGTVHPYLAEYIPTWVAERRYPEIKIVSAREMHLIIAENALAGGDTDGFTTAINNLRALDGLTPYSGQVDAVLLLNESRQANLFLQGRRLADHYRFGDPSPEWIETSEARNQPGTFLPIPTIELEANPNLQ